MTCNKQTRVTSVAVSDSEVGNAMRHQACHCHVRMGDGTGLGGGGGGGHREQLLSYLDSDNGVSCFSWRSKVGKKLFRGLFGEVPRANREGAPTIGLCPDFHFSHITKYFSPLVCIPLDDTLSLITPFFAFLADRAQK